MVYGNGVMKETDSFTADEAEFLYADADDFASAVENGSGIKKEGIGRDMFIHFVVHG